MVIYRQFPPTDGGNGGGSRCVTDREEKILSLMRENPHISVSAIVAATGVGKRSIERVIAKMKSMGMIERIGTFGGVWKIR